MPRTGAGRTVLISTGRGEQGRGGAVTTYGVSDRLWPALPGAATTARAALLADHPARRTG
ncbi:hypothetical protein [Polymorphospora rubra]|uniref:hypothetical protein n=1 Tax=Polymorphospora rubra TaxID=338584 RepID=UPI001BB40ABE|nr:hypothetical protein [Polymorphospora rubra]